MAFANTKEEKLNKDEPAMHLALSHAFKFVDTNQYSGFWTKVFIASRGFDEFPWISTEDILPKQTYEDNNYREEVLCITNKSKVKVLSSDKVTVKNVKLWKPITM